MGALYSVIDPATGQEVERRWFPDVLDPKTYVSDPSNPGGKRYMVLLDGDAPPPPDPNAELDAALAEVQAGLPNVSTVADLKTALNDMIDAMRGRAGKAGRVAGRPV